MDNRLKLGNKVYRIINKDFLTIHVQEEIIFKITEDVEGFTYYTESPTGSLNWHVENEVYESFQEAKGAVIELITTVLQEQAVAEPKRKRVLKNGIIP